MQRLNNTLILAILSTWLIGCGDVSKEHMEDTVSPDAHSQKEDDTEMETGPSYTPYDPVSVPCDGLPDTGCSTDDPCRKLGICKHPSMICEAEIDLNRPGCITGPCLAAGEDLSCDDGNPCTHNDMLYELFEGSCGCTGTPKYDAKDCQESDPQCTKNGVVPGNSCEYYEECSDSSCQFETGKTICKCHSKRPTED